MSDFFDDIENIDTRDVSQKHWDMTFEIRVDSDFRPDYRYITKLINRNINACNFRNSEITEYEIEEDGVCVNPVDHFSYNIVGCSYKKTYRVNINGILKSIEDAVELLTAVVFTKNEQSEIVLDGMTLNISFSRNNECYSTVFGTDTPRIFRKDKVFSIDTQSSDRYTQAIIDVVNMVQSMVGEYCTVTYYEICYLLNAYIIRAAFPTPVLKMHRLLLETEDYLPDNSTLHGYSTLDVQNIPCSWRDENTIFVANSCDPSKSYHSPKTFKPINMSVVKQLLFNTPKDILVTISLNNFRKFETSLEDNRVCNENYWKEVYKMNENTGVCIVDSNKNIDYPQLVNEFIKNYKSKIRHSRKMEHHLQIFHNSKKNTAGVVIDLCMCYIKSHNTLALVTLGLYGAADRVYDFKDRLFNITNPRG